MSIINLIPVGYKNRISRVELSKLSDTTDFSTRRAIARASLVCPVVNDGTGYFIPDFQNKEDTEVAKRYSASMKKRAYAELARARVIDGFVGTVNNGNVYASARKLANLTQKQLAEKVGMTVPEISKIENGRTMPTPEQHHAIEKACGLKI